MVIHTYRKKYTIGSIQPKLVAETNLLKKLQSMEISNYTEAGDFAFFDKLQSLKYDQALGDETNVGHAKQYQALEVLKFEYTFADA